MIDPIVYKDLVGLEQVFSQLGTNAELIKLAVQNELISVYVVVNNCRGYYSPKNEFGMTPNIIDGKLSLDETVIDYRLLDISGIWELCHFNAHEIITHGNGECNQLITPYGEKNKIEEGINISDSHTLEFIIDKPFHLNINQLLISKVEWNNFYSTIKNNNKKFTSENSKATEITRLKNINKSLMQILLGMAIDEYSYQPGKKNTATGESLNSIFASLERVGLGMDSQTIRGHLKEASSIYKENLHANVIKNK